MASMETRSPSITIPRTATASPMVSARVALPLLVVVGYVAFILTGFGTDLGSWQPLPVFTFFGLCLIALQILISETKSPARMAYVVLTSVFALIYAADITLNHARHGAFTRNPITYIVLNTLLVIVFVVDALTRRRKYALAAASAGTDGETATAAPYAPYSFNAFAADFAGLSILFLIASLLLSFLDQTGIVRVDLNATLGVHLPTTIQLLPDLDRVIALAGAGITLLLLGIIGVVTVAVNQSGRVGNEKDSAAVRGFGGALVRISRTAFSPVLLSLRMVLGPLIWLGSAFSIAYAAKAITDYLNSSAQSTGNIAALFNPLSHNSVTRYGQGLATVGLMLLAIATVIISVAIIEHDLTIIGRLLQIIATVGRAIALTLAFFTFSLACVNAVVNLASSVKNEPFQVGAFTILALVAGIAFAGYAAVIERSKTA